jgi:hypothetical protein
MGVANWCRGLRLRLAKVAVLLYWKNLTLKRRHKYLTFLNVLIPTCLYLTLLSLFLALGRDLAPSSANTTTPMPSNLISDYCGR